ncbi:hypothetical protein DFH07DRAFT_1023868 [Mycena maculata]|uniref:Uncharacterized protein n=1 Tax=Mycena maculata TaxID=230809 RepID=A0AAD7NGY9_9AGAR|nr:hypothetical protein DFH07DRAFT_1023868 [Mycena maculata]
MGAGRLDSFILGNKGEEVSKIGIAELLGQQALYVKRQRNNPGYELVTVRLHNEYICPRKQGPGRIEQGHKDNDSTAPHKFSWREKERWFGIDGELEHRQAREVEVHVVQCASRRNCGVEDYAESQWTGQCTERKPRGSKQHRLGVDVEIKQAQEAGGAYGAIHFPQERRFDVTQRQTKSSISQQRRWLANIGMERVLGVEILITHERKMKKT